MTTPDDIEAIRKRHEKLITDYGDEPWTEDCLEDAVQAHADRARLLATIDALSAPVTPVSTPAVGRDEVIEECIALIDCGGCKGVERLKDGSCVRACSGDCFEELANEMRALKTIRPSPSGHTAP